MDQQRQQVCLEEISGLTSRVQDALMAAEGEEEKREELTTMMERLEKSRSMVENPQETVGKMRQALYRG